MPLRPTWETPPLTQLDNVRRVPARERLHLPRLARTDRVRAPRRRERSAREHDAGVRARGSARLPLRRDRRARHRRRRAARLPRRRPRPRHRPQTGGSTSCPGRWCARRRSTVASRSRCSTTCSRVAGSAGQHRPEARRGRRRRSPRTLRDVRRGRPRVHRRVQRRRLERVRALLPGVCTSLGPLGIAAARPRRARRADRCRLPAPCVQVPTHYLDTEIVTPASSRRPTRRGMAVHVWTIDDAAEMERLLDLGVDGIMTDRPEGVARGARTQRAVGVVIVPLTPLDFLARARRLFPTALESSTEIVRYTYSDFGERCDRLASMLVHDARRPARRPGGVAVRQRPRVPRGVLRRAARRRRAAAAQHPPRRAGDPASCSPTAGRSCCSGSRPARPRTSACDRWCSATSWRPWLAAQPGRPFPVPDVDEDRRPSSSTRRARPVAEGPLLSHRGLYLHAIHNALTGGLVRRRRRRPHDPPLPRQRLGDAALPHGPRRRERDAPPLRRRRGAAPDRGRGRHPAPRGADDDADRSSTTRRSPDATSRRSARSRSAGAAGPDLVAEVEERLGCECICGYGMTESSPTITRSLDKPGEPIGASAARPRACPSSGCRCAWSTTTTSRCRGTTRPSARSWPARTT